MSLGNWGQSLLRDAAGAFFGSEYLRDYTHASKVFRSNSYQNAPHLKFLFHTYFEINPAVGFGGETNFGVLVKETKLPAYSVQTTQLNQYNRKRIVQTKVKYDPIEMSFHDDNMSQVTKMWEAYFRYYYNDLTNARKSMNINAGRNQYNGSITGNDDWGFNGGTTPGQETKAPFFNSITVFGFNQHNYTAYKLVNPIITSFQHDSYNYAESAGTMTNRMTIDYETVIYDYGSMKGSNADSSVPGFGNSATYDTTPSPIAAPGSNDSILGRGGLIDAVDMTLGSLQQGNILNAVKVAGTAYNTIKNSNLKTILNSELDQMLRNATQNTPNNRNAHFSFQKAAATPGPLGLASSPTINASSNPTPITNESTAGKQINSSPSYSQPTDKPFGGPTTLA